MDIFTVALIGAIVLMGLLSNMVWLAVVGALLMAAYFYGARNERPVPAGGGGPKIRPIIVKRRYDGPASIYPSMMKIRVNPAWNTRNWFENAFSAAAQLGVGALLMARRSK